MLKRAIWPSVDFRSLDGEISESKGKHAVGKVRASSRRLRKCFFLFSYSCYMSLKQTFSIAKLQQHPICGKAHMVGAYSFIYRWSQLSCMSFTFCLRCDVWPVIVRSDLCCGSESVLGARRPDETIHQRGLIFNLLSRSLLFMLRETAMSLYTICLLQACFTLRRSLSSA